MSNGFQLSQAGEYNKHKLNKDEKRAQSELIADITDELFNEFLRADAKERLNEKFTSLTKNITFLNLPQDNTILLKIENVICNKYQVQ